MFRIIRRAIFYGLVLLALYIWVERSRDQDRTPEPTAPETAVAPLGTDKSFAVPAPRPDDLGVISESADEIYVDKSERVMELRSEGKVIAHYKIALGFAPDGHKTREGDGKTPIGEYTIDWRNQNSQFYRSLHISYPRADQTAAAKREGRTPGGMIMIHGQPNGSPYVGFDAIAQDWTNGCIAVSNAEMDRIWALVDDGTPIKIVE